MRLWVFMFIFALSRVAVRLKTAAGFFFSFNLTL